MPDLTLEQVKAVGRDAEWRGAAGQVAAVVRWSGERASLDGTIHYYVGGEEVSDPDAHGTITAWDYWPPRDGWHHLPGCDCEFCQT